MAMRVLSIGKRSCVFVVADEKQDDKWFGIAAPAAAPGPHPDGGPARLGYATPEFSMRRDPHAKLCDDAAAAVEIEAVLVAWGEGSGVELSDGAWLRRSVFGARRRSG
jgi:hypothetical protein